MWKIRTFVSIALMSFTLIIQAQVVGNEWIDYTKSYYRIRVIDDGIYRVNASELAVVGVPVNNIAVNKYQLFRRGVEVAINVRDDNNDGRLDYLEFYGQRNDGAADKELYVSPDAQPHDYYSLFSDSAAYFLTWHASSSPSLGKRISFSNVRDSTGLSAQPFHMASSLQLQTNAYNPGFRYGSGGDIQNPAYEYGEGWTGSNISKNQSKSFSFVLNDAITSGTPPLIEVVLAGISSFDHVADISVGPSEASVRKIGTVTFQQRNSQRFSAYAAWSDVAANGNLVVKITVIGVTGQTDVLSVSSVKVDYAQGFSISGTSKTFNTVASGNTRGYMKVTATTTAPATFRALDITDATNPISLSPSLYADRLDLVVTNFSQARKLHVFSTVKAVGSLQKVDFLQMNFATANYLIVAHPTMDNTTGGINPVSEYAAYRSSAEGGSFNVINASILDIYDQFGFGDPSPVALRRFCTYAVNNGSAEYLFIIGKGYTPNYNVFRSTATVTNYVPTYGFPGSDLLFAVDPSDGDLIPDLAVGRLNALSSAEVKTYLDKVKEMEQTPYDALWRKNLIHLSGGQTASELAIFKSYISSFEVIAEGDFLGGKVSSKSKATTDAVELIDVKGDVNKGVSLITFFGHSSSIVTDIEIGRASNPDEGYINKGKYPVLLVNGCNAGGIFATVLTFGEDWIKTPNAGALGVIANSDYALSSGLRRWSDLFYKEAFTKGDQFGLSVGKIIHNLIIPYYEVYGTDIFSQSQIFQTLFQGDPAIKLFGSQSPDFALSGNELTASSFGSDRVLASADSFLIEVPVQNFGRTISDSLGIKLERTLADGTQLTSFYKRPSVRRLDTLELSVKNDQTLVNEGINNFLVTLDPGNLIEELNEVNNSASLEIFIPRGNTIPLFPIDFAQVGQDKVDLVWQSANQLSDVRSFQLAIDTTTSFSSPFHKQEIISGSLIMNHEIDLATLPDSTTVFWRTRFDQSQPNEDTSWVQHSFTKVQAGGNGWIQSNERQFDLNSFSGVSFSPLTGKMSFQETSTDVSVNTHGVGHPNGYDAYQVIVDGINLLATNNAADPVCKKLNAVNAVVFDRQSAQPTRPLGISGSDVSNDLVCGRLPQMIYNFSESEMLGGSRYLDLLIDRMDDGDMILLFSFDSVAFSNWDTQLKSSLNLVGIENSLIDGLTNGQPLVILGKKGESIGSAARVINDGSAIPIKNQAISFVGAATGKYSEGSTKSTLIGPAKKWNSFLLNLAAEASDFWNLEVNAVNTNGQELSVLDINTVIGSIDLSSVDANLFPYLYFNLNFSDNQLQTPIKLGSWSVDYDLPPEGVISGGNTTPLKLQEGEDFSSSYLFQNLSSVDFSDSLDVSIRYVNVSSGVVEVEQQVVGPPLSGDSVKINLITESQTKIGDNSLSLTVRPRETELYGVNNIIKYPVAFTVSQDNANPVLDVTFDGGYILNGDIVSPNPNILIRLKDENTYLFKQDTSGIMIELKAPCETCIYERVNFTGAKLTYTPAAENQDYELSYAPGPLVDGVYGLRVQGVDQTGNKSGAEPYEITFEVINESTITHFYPYPNPFSTSTRFVFTLTGSNIPDQIKIQIMTVSGRVVREITQDQIGPLKIGNNISQYAWDGRDEYGDQLANGVYLYKVFIRSMGKEMDHRNTTADKAFKNGFGKIYLLR
jgi:hypothetical protein